MVGWIGRLFGRLAGCLVGWFTCWLVDWLDVVPTLPHRADWTNKMVSLSGVRVRCSQATHIYRVTSISVGGLQRQLAFFTILERVDPHMG